MRTVAYAYDNLGADYMDVDYRLPDQMSGYWTAFVRTGDPSAPALPSWPTLANTPGSVIAFSTEGGKMTTRPCADAIYLWMDYEGPIP